MLFRSRRIHRLRGFRRPLFRVNSDLAEVVAETAFHEGAGLRIERPASAEGLQQAVGGGCVQVGRIWRVDPTLNQRVLSGTGRARRSATGARGARSFLPSVRNRHAHHPVGDAVGFLLVRIVRLADMQLGLNRACMKQTLQPLVAKGPVKLLMRRNVCPRDRRRANGHRGSRATLMCE